MPGGQVPSRAVAYRRLDELDKGRRTFGEAKQRRSVAHRPTGVLGQLTPTRPGEYVLMDGYRLDVFAMEPVTNRWVNTELTVAMDLYDRGIRGIPAKRGGRDHAAHVTPRVLPGRRHRLGSGPAAAARLPTAAGTSPTPTARTTPAVRQPDG